MEKSSHQVKVKVMDASELYDPEFRELIKSKKPTIIIPVGSLEQHGAHLPITTDSDIVTEIASRLAKKCGFIVFPTVSYGVSEEHAPLFNASVTTTALRTILANTILSLIENGITSIIILNGHHGNIKTLLRLVGKGQGFPSVILFQSFRSKLGWTEVKDLQKDVSIPLRSMSYWNFMEHEFDHAGFVETSIMLLMRDKVLKKKIQKKYLKDFIAIDQKNLVNILVWV